MNDLWLRAGVAWQALLRGEAGVHVSDITLSTLAAVAYAVRNRPAVASRLGR